MTKESRSKNPYSDLPEKAYWKPSVAQRSLFDIDEIWTPKFKILPSHRVSTFGSCFAQHIGRALSENGYTWVNYEPAPEHLPREVCREYNYGIFSARTANIYTTSLLNQWVNWARGISPPNISWVESDRVFDPFRPTIEPRGFTSYAEMSKSREVAISAFRRCIVESDVFVFTLGLTESWIDASGWEYPMCPGTAAGEYNSNSHVFYNQEYSEISQSLTSAMEGMKSLNQDIRFILTTSPVPLTATNSGHHVVVATMESKSILRAVAGHLARRRSDTDYFPSYEIISSPAFRAAFFEPNMREVNARGVSFVMEQFFSGLNDSIDRPTAPREVRAHSTSSQASTDVICEEELLEAFGGGSK